VLLCHRVRVLGLFTLPSECINLVDKKQKVWSFLPELLKLDDDHISSVLLECLMLCGGFRLAYLRCLAQSSNQLWPTSELKIDQLG